MKEVWKDLFLVLLLPGMVLFVGVALYLDKKEARTDKTVAATRVEEPAEQTLSQTSDEPSVEEDILIKIPAEQTSTASDEKSSVQEGTPGEVVAVPVLKIESAVLEQIKTLQVTPQQQLWTACRDANEPEVLALLAQGIDPNFYINGFTPLITACFKDNVTIVKALLKADALSDVAADTTDGLAGLTALMAASWEGHAEVVKELLAAGANVNTRARDGRTALMFASYHGHPEVVKLLLKAGAQVNDRAFDRPGTSLTFAAQNGHLEVVQILLEAGAVDYNNLSLRVAQRFEYDDIVKILEEAKQKNKQ